MRTFFQDGEEQHLSKENLQDVSMGDADCKDFLLVNHNLPPQKIVNRSKNSVL